MRSVPRNIDRPNRNAEYAATFMVSWYGTMFLVGSPLMAFGVTILSIYLMYRLTLNKPEGGAYRLWYKYFGIGKFVPPPRKINRFEI